MHGLTETILKYAAAGVEAEFLGGLDLGALEEIDRDLQLHKSQGWEQARFQVRDAIVKAAGTSDTKWDGSASNYKDAAAYCSACLIDLNESGEPKVQAKCHLPVRDPAGQVNSNGVHAAAAALGGGRSPIKVPVPHQMAAAKTLLGLYEKLGETPPASLKQLAAGNK